MSFFEHIAEIDRTVQEHLGGVPVIYRPAVGEPVEVTGMFDAQYVLVKGSAAAGVESRGPAVFLRLADLPSDPDQDDPILTIQGTDYRVSERRPDDVGGIVLVLKLRLVT